MASVKETGSFFTHGDSKQYEFVLTLYPQALKLKAKEKKLKKPEDLLKLDAWYQEELPKKIRARGKDAHLTHDELVQCMKWKLTRGKFYSQMINLVMINTPKAVATETRKALRKLPNLESALNNLSSLKGVGTTMATAILAAAAPEIAPFMADECLMAIPDIEGLDYTAKEYLKYVQHIRTVVDRLNAENQNSAWSPHRVELALWCHYVTRKLEPSLLDGIPGLEEESKENAVDGKDSEDSSSGPLALANTEDSSEATNDSLSVVINSEETSREPTTNGNGNDTTNDNTNDNTTNDHDSSLADGVPTNGASVVAPDDNAAVVGGRDDNAVIGGDDNAVVDQEELSLEPSSKKIRLQEPEEGTA
ncbi:uncharacterized protein LOC124209798 isoform X2 [Daphnia pulex]|uniref:uncharacterized protein LOC124209798 isoform X2 n=1 Tax=Daphnia pulex TaxID=6669 RepID=UPI001EDEBDA2|nr:uncharacterized protein LOC124209798 isoform X2 [Daphnia pulex]